MSLAEIAAMTGIPLAEFTAEWGVPAEDLGLPMKDIKDRYGFTPGGRPRLGGGPPRRSDAARACRARREPGRGPVLHYASAASLPVQAAAASRRGGRAVECGGLENR